MCQRRRQTEKRLVDYRVEVAETVASPEGKGSFITSVVTQRAAESDEAGLTATLQKQEGLGLEKPTDVYPGLMSLLKRSMKPRKPGGN